MVIAKNKDFGIDIGIDKGAYDTDRLKIDVKQNLNNRG